jgi:hypothetical protein
MRMIFVANICKTLNTCKIEDANLSKFLGKNICFLLNQHITQDKQTANRERKAVLNITDKIKNKHWLIVPGIVQYKRSVFKNCGKHVMHKFC